MDNLLTVHFHSMHGDYSRYSMWKWLDGYWAKKPIFHVRMILVLLVRLLLPPIVLLILSIFGQNGRLVEANT